MKAGIALLFILVFALPHASVAQGKHQKFAIEIWQNDTLVPIHNNKVKLHKAPFVIQVKLYGQEGIYLNSSFEPNWFALDSNQAVPDIETLAPKSFAEEPFNKDRELYVHSEDVSYLFYDKNLDWHRFDKDIQVDKDRVSATRTVEKLFDLNAQKEIEIANIDRNLYLFFLATKGDKKVKELQRFKLCISWY